MINAALAAELEILTAALDEPGADIAHSLRELALTAASAIASYLGLSVLVASDPPLAFSAMADGVAADDVRTSLHVVLPGVGDGLTVAVNLYAGTPGAFVDLAADLAWLTTRPLSDFVLDEHLTVPGPSHTGLRAGSIINQAIGVLIDRGHTPEQAIWQLDTQADRAGTDRHGAAQLVLATLTAPDADHVAGPFE
jgi:hypothetical protein